MGRNTGKLLVTAAAAFAAGFGSHEIVFSPEPSVEKAPAPKTASPWKSSQPRPKWHSIPKPQKAPSWTAQQQAMAPAILSADRRAQYKGLRVGNEGWVKLAKPIFDEQAGRRSNEVLRAGEECVIVRGSRLAVRDAEVIYKDSSVGGTVCPDGSKLDLSVRQAHLQNKAYQGFLRKEMEVLSEISELPEVDSSAAATEQSWHWVDVVDSPRQTQANIDYGYGDICGIEGRVTQMGELSTGESVMRLQAIDQQPGGTICPAGTVFLAGQ